MPPLLLCPPSLSHKLYVNMYNHPYYLFSLYLSQTLHPHSRLSLFIPLPLPLPGVHAPRERSLEWDSLSAAGPDGRQYGRPRSRGDHIWQWVHHNRWDRTGENYTLKSFLVSQCHVWVERLMSKILNVSHDDIWLTGRDLVLLFFLKTISTYKELLFFLSQFAGVMWHSVLPLYVSCWCYAICPFYFISPGASSDFDSATKIAKLMVTRFGMCEKVGRLGGELKTEKFRNIRSDCVTIFIYCIHHFASVLHIFTCWLFFLSSSWVWWPTLMWPSRAQRHKLRWNMKSGSYWRSVEDRMPHFIQLTSRYL